MLWGAARWVPGWLLPGLLCHAHATCPTMTRREYAARFVLTKVADMVLRSPQLWHPGPRRQLREAVERRFAEKVRAGGAFAKLQIGANDMSHGDSSRAASSEGEPVFSFLSTQEGGHTLVFVEANPLLEEPLRQNVARLFPNASETQVVSAAVCENSFRSVPFYRLSAAFFESHPELKALSQMSSLDRTWIQQCQGMFPHINLTEGWEEVPVRCLSPAELLGEVGLRPEDVDAITVDVEGLETQLLGLFLDLEGFAPLVVEFDVFTAKYVQDSESHFLSSSLLPLIARLAATGYDVHHSADGAVALRA